MRCHACAVTASGVAQNASLKVDDIVVGINGTTLRNGDEMSSYLEENTLPGELTILTVVRNGVTLYLTTTLGKRPPLPVWSFRIRRALELSSIS